MVGGGNVYLYEKAKRLDKMTVPPVLNDRDLLLDKGSISPVMAE